MGWTHGAMMHPTWWTQRLQAIEDEISKSFVRKKKKKVLDFVKLNYYKEVLDFRNIENHIVFLIPRIPSQQCHIGDLPKNSSTI